MTLLCGCHLGLELLKSVHYTKKKKKDYTSEDKMCFIHKTNFLTKLMGCSDIKDVYLMLSFLLCLMWLILIGLNLNYVVNSGMVCCLFPQFF